MYTLGQEHFQDEARQPEPIQFTAGAVQVINRKGEVSMQKVHVKRCFASQHMGVTCFRSFYNFVDIFLNYL